MVDLVPAELLRRSRAWMRRPGVRARRLLTDAGTLLFPTLCVHCDRTVSGGAWSPLLCRRCAASIRRWDRGLPVPAPLARGLALAEYEGPVRTLLVDLKFRGLLRAGHRVGRAMAQARGARRSLAEADVIVPVPLHWWRRWRRGHSQAAVLARSLAREAGVTCVGALRRPRATRPQVGLDRRDRRANVRGAFDVPARRRASVAGARVLLVDDVVTTGATAAAAAVALRRAGARRVELYAAAVAAAPGPGT